MHRNHNSIPKSNAQHWLTTDRAPETYSYNMTSRPPGSVLPIPQHHHHNNSPLQHPVAYHPPIHHKDIIPSPPPHHPLTAQALDSEHAAAQQKGNNRSVIPSKRAAQNRAAQKAFRQRREQYIKDLELKAKEMEDWQDEMDKLRNENKELRGKVLALENQVAVLTGGHVSHLPKPSPGQRTGSDSQQQDSDKPETEGVDRNSPDESTKQSPSKQIGSTNDTAKEEGPFIPAPAQASFESPLHRSDEANSVLTVDNKRRKILEESASSSSSSGHSASQVSMPAHTSAMPVSEASSTTHPPHQQHELTGLHPSFWNSNTTGSNMSNLTAVPTMGDFDLDFDFDPFFEEEFGPTITNSNDFLPNANSGQVLDDLFAMLQTRQRPQIPMIPTEEISEHVQFNEAIGKLA